MASRRAGFRVSPVSASRRTAAPTARPFRKITTCIGYRHKHRAPHALKVKVLRCVSVSTKSLAPTATKE
jgi:hypothetical protein